MGKNAKYNDFNEYYHEVYSRLPPKIKGSKTLGELQELISELYYKGTSDVSAILLIETFYSIYKKHLK